MAKTSNTEKKSDSAAEEKEVLTRTTISLTPSKLKKVKYMGLLQDKDISDYVNEGLDHVLAEYEKKNGLIPIK